MLSYAETVRAADAIERVIEESSYGWANRDAMNAISAELFKLRRCSDAYTSEKVGIIETRVPDLYSPRKANKWGGSEMVKRDILRACQSLKDRAAILERQLTEG